MKITLYLILFLILVLSIYYEMVLNKTYFIPFFTLISSYYFILHGIFPIYTTPNVVHLPYDRDARIESILFTLAFVSFQFIGYTVVLRSISFQKRPILDQATAALKLASWVLMVGYFIIHFVLQRYSIPSLPQLEAPCWYFAFSTLTFLLLRRQLTWPHIVALVVAVIAKLFIDLFIGFLTPILFSVVIIFSAASSLKYYRTMIVSRIVCVSLFGSYGYIKHLSKTTIKGTPSNIYQFTP